MIFKDPTDKVNGDMVVIDSGNLDIYNKINGVRRKTSYLTGAVTGVCAANTWTQLPGYWQEAPSVIFAPKNLTTYFSKYMLVTQKFTLTSTVSLVRTGVYQVFPCLTYYMGATSSYESPNLYIAGSDTDTIFIHGPASPHPELFTPFYLCQGGILTITFKYRVSFGQQTQGSAGFIYLFNTNVYLDVSRGYSVTSYTVASRSAWTGDAEQTVTVSIDVGDGLCQWRLRRTTYFSQSGSGTPNITAYDSYLILVSYNYSFPTKTISPTNSLVSYLAIGR